MSGLCSCELTRHARDGGQGFRMGSTLAKLRAEDVTFSSVAMCTLCSAHPMVTHIYRYVLRQSAHDHVFEAIIQQRHNEGAEHSSSGVT